jgi:hypothetical protein
VAEFEGELKGHRAKAVEIADTLASVYRRARRLGQLRADLTPQVAALETVAFLMGLMRLWLLDQHGTIVRPGAAALIRGHVNGRRCHPLQRRVRAAHGSPHG